LRGETSSPRPEKRERGGAIDYWVGGGKKRIRRAALDEGIVGRERGFVSPYDQEEKKKKKREGEKAFAIYPLDPVVKGGKRGRGPLIIKSLTRGKKKKRKRGGEGVGGIVFIIRVNPEKGKGKKRKKKPRLLSFPRRGRKKKKQRGKEGGEDGPLSL